jgi:very-short-patch-repair endonuclease
MTLPEILLWRALKLRPDGLKLRKQHRAGDYVLDFYCASARLAIEVDGEVHADPAQAEHDRRRDAWLARRDVRVLRIPAAAVLRDIAAVVDGIVAHASKNPPRNGEVARAKRGSEGLGSTAQAPPSSLRDATSPCRGGIEEAP